jgi:ATP-dependent protease ClpP protease subunit
MPGLAEAADIKLIEKANSPARIVVSGEIVESDVASFLRIAAPLGKALVVFEDSPGGSLKAALTIGRIIHARGYTTAVERGECLSACAIIWVAGTRRVSGKNARIGFHAAVGRHEKDGPISITGDSNATVGAYLKELSLSDAFIRFATYASVDDMEFLDRSTAAATGLIVEWEGLETEEKKQQAYAWHNEAVSQRFSAKPNLNEAVRLYKLAAEANYAGSQNNLGDLYENGVGVPKIPEFAIYWFTRSAERGEPTAYLGLSTLLPKLSKEPDVLTEATKFAILAVRELGPGRNKAAAEAILAELKTLLSPEQFGRANALADAWTPLYNEPHLMSDAPVPKKAEANQ